MQSTDDTTALPNGKRKVNARHLQALCGTSAQGASQARTAVTNAVTPVSRVGWMTGAKPGL